MTSQTIQSLIATLKALAPHAPTHDAEAAIHRQIRQAELDARAAANPDAPRPARRVATRDEVEP